MDTKTFALEVKEVSEDGTFTGYASVFGNEDSYGDVVDPGAFSKTITDRKSPVKMLWQHDPSQPIGVYTEMAEDDHGLLVRGAFNMDTQRGREAYSLLKQGALDGLSIGYTTIKDVIDAGVRRLKELKLWEVSLVTFPANELATVTSVKADGDMAAAVKNLTEAISELKALLGENEPGAAHSDDPDAGAADEDKAGEPDLSTLRSAIDAMKATVREAA